MITSTELTSEGTQAEGMYTVYSGLFSYGGNFRIFHIMEHLQKSGTMAHNYRFNVTILSCTKINNYISAIRVTHVMCDTI